MIADSASTSSRTGFSSDTAWTLAITALALLLREWFVLVTGVENPIRGDIVQYVAYAFNLLTHGVFSMAQPGAETVLADAYRGPGYPMFLAIAMLVGGLDGGWYPLALQLQVLLGTATVLLAVLVARAGLPRPMAFGAGLLAAVWPHHVAATGALLSEVVFGFVLMLGLYLTVLGTNGRIRWFLAAGVSFATAWLVNPLALGLPILLALLVRRRNGWKASVALMAVVVVVAGAWSARNAMLEEGRHSDVGRAALNFVQGSWPQYHRAHATARTNEISAQIMREIDREADLLRRAPIDGAQAISERMSADPAYYLRWYLFSKPFLLWSWDIRIGAGGIYFHRVSNSPLDRAPLSAVLALLKALNPVLFALALGATVVLLFGLRHSHPDRKAGEIVAVFFAYVTMVHLALQAEPRYATAYRPEQMVLAMTAVAMLLGRVRQLRDARASRHEPTR